MYGLIPHPFYSIPFPISYFLFPSFRQPAPASQPANDNDHHPHHPSPRPQPPTPADLYPYFGTYLLISSMSNRLCAHLSQSIRYPFPFPPYPTITHSVSVSVSVAYRIVSIPPPPPCRCLLPPPQPTPTQPQHAISSRNTNMRIQTDPSIPENPARPDPKNV